MPPAVRTIEPPGRLTRAGEDALLQAIPGSRLVAHAGASHALHWEEPERFAADVAAFAAAHRR